MALETSQARDQRRSPKEPLSPADRGEKGTRGESPQRGSRHLELARLLEHGTALLDEIRQDDGKKLRLAQEEEARLAAELEASRREADSLIGALSKLERRTTQLTRLYVATFQLYLGRTPEKVYDTIAEITTDILGAERFALLVRVGDDLTSRIVLRHGIAAESDDPFARDVYPGGHDVVDQVLRRGVRWICPGPGTPVAVVPLQVDSVVLGALVILDLLEHKPLLDDSDSELLDLLGAHTASALLSSTNRSYTSLKIQTMTRLLRLIIDDSRRR